MCVILTRKNSGALTTKINGVRLISLYLCTVLYQSIIVVYSIKKQKHQSITLSATRVHVIVIYI